MLGKAKRDRILKSLNEPHFAKPRGAPERAEQNGFPSQNALGGALRRPRNDFQKVKKFYRGAYLQPRSNLFYQKFVRKTITRPRLAGAGRNETKKIGSRAKNFLS